MSTLTQNEAQMPCSTASSPCQNSCQSTVESGYDAYVDEEKSYVSPYGKTFVKNIWYFAVPADKLKRGQVVAKVIVNQPIMIGRDKDGKVFAIQDICPHQAVPLSAGPFDGENVACPFHGWKFDTNGVCTEIPSLCSDQKMNLRSIRTLNYPCREVLDSVWVYIGAYKDEKDLPEVPHAPGQHSAISDTDIFAAATGQAEADFSLQILTD